MSQLTIPKPLGSVVSVNNYTGSVSLSTSDIPEHGSLYFTLTRAASAISINNTAGNNYRGTLYNISTGVINISASYLTATPYTFVLRDSLGGINATNGTFSELTVSDVLSVQNALYVPDLYVTTIHGGGGGSSSISLSSNPNFIVDTQYLNGGSIAYVSAVLSLSTQNSYLPVGGIKIDPLGGSNYTIIIPVIALGGVYVDASGYVLSGAYVQVNAWIPTGGTFIFTQIQGVSGQTSVSIVSGSSQQVFFN